MMLLIAVNEYVIIYGRAQEKWLLLLILIKDETFMSTCGSYITPRSC